MSDIRTLLAEHLSEVHKIGAGTFEHLDEFWVNGAPVKTCCLLVVVDAIEAARESTDG